MRIVFALLVLALAVSPAAAEPSVRAFSIVEALEVDEQTGNKLIDLLTRYDADVDKLVRTRAELKARLVIAHRDAQGADKLLLDWTANQRAFAALEDQLLARARQSLPGQKAVKLLMLLSLTEATPPPDAPPPTTYATKPPSRRPGYNPDALFPPGSPNRPPCDPFASMHGCRY